MNTQTCITYFISFLLIVLLSVPALTQDHHLGELKKRTYDRIERVIRDTDGVVGLAVLDIVSGERFFHNEQLIFPQASAIKIPILIELMKRSQEGEIDLDERVIVEEISMVAGSGILQFFSDGGSAVSLRDLAMLMIVISDNTATNILIDRLEMDAVNRTMQELGVSNTLLQRKMIQPEASARGDENLSTPSDAMAIMEMLYHGRGIKPEVAEAVLEFLTIPKGTSLTGSIPSSVRVATKPGGLTGVSTEWAIVYLERRPYIIVYMGNYGMGDTHSEAIGEISRILYDYFYRLSLSTPYGTRVPLEYLR
jgi:beta-lactamase class A